MFNYLKNKSGVSGVVSTVLLIAITVMAAAIVINFVLIFTDAEKQLAPATQCIEAQTDRLLTISSACFDQANSEIKLVLSRSPVDGIEISTLTFALFDGADSVHYECGTFQCGGCNVLQPGVSRTYYIDTREFSPQTLEISINNGCLLASYDSFLPC